MTAARGGAATPPWIPPVAVATAALAALPLVYLFVRALEGGWSGFAAAVASPLTLRLLGRTLGLVAAVALGATAIAVPMAWLVVRTDLPGRRLWAVLGALPLVFPSYVAALAFVSALGPRGLLAQALAPLGVDRLPPLAYGASGAWLVLTLATYPYLFLLLVAALTLLDPALEEASRSLGRGARQTFLRVVLPQLRPALVAGSLLVVLYTLSDFGAVSIVRYNTFTLAIYNAYQGLFDRSTAAALGTVLVLLTLAFIAARTLAGGGAAPHRLRPATPPRPLPLGRWRTPALALVAGVALAGVALPTVVVALWGVRGALAGAPLEPSWQGALGSLGTAAAAAVAAAALALPIAWWAVRRPGPVSNAVERLCHAGYALPGIVIALSLVFLAARYLRPLYQSLALLLAAYLIRFLPEALASTRAALEAVGPRFEEAAASLGRRPGSVLATVTLPLVRPGVLAGAGLVFLTTMKELPATLLLRPTGFETLATRVWSAASEGIYSQAAVPALLLVALSAPSVYWLIIRPALAGTVRRALPE